MSKFDLKWRILIKMAQKNFVKHKNFVVNSTHKWKFFSFMMCKILIITPPGIIITIIIPPGIIISVIIPETGMITEIICSGIR